MKLDSAGWLDEANRVPSPNCDERPDNEAPWLIVIHSISLPPGIFGGHAVEELFTNHLDWDAHPYYGRVRGLKVSAHFLIRRDGELTQFVPCSLRAWHAGPSQWQGREKCNDFSIGIEMEGTDDQPFTDGQYARLNEVIAALEGGYPIRAIAGHSDVAPGRKTDPGPCFDWRRITTKTDAACR
jgi:N-acetyl-anhydromuramoyl-L-alanine amidase